MLLPGVHVETTHAPDAYSDEQLIEMCLIAFYMGRGKFAFTLEPEHDCLASGIACLLCEEVED